VNIGELAAHRLDAKWSSEETERAGWIDIEVAEGLVARVRYIREPSRYEIRVGLLSDGYLLEQSAPFEASFGPEFDNAMAALSQ